LGGLQSAVGGLSELMGFGYGGDASGDALVSIENVIGSAYNDIFYGSRANNVLTGNGGVDTFVFNRNIGHDTITDFDATGGNHDIIRFEGVFDSWNDLQNNMQDTGDDVVIWIDNHNSVTLENVSFNQLGASDFDFT
jgi:Ca2+-binding RTX toxin-like protein